MPNPPAFRARHLWRRVQLIGAPMVLTACTGAHPGTQLLATGQGPMAGSFTGPSQASEASPESTAWSGKESMQSTTIAVVPSTPLESTPPATPSAASSRIGRRTTPSDGMASGGAPAASGGSTAVVDLEASPAAGSNRRPVTATLQVTVGRPVAVDSLPNLTRTCADTFESFGQMDLATSDAVAQPIRLTLTITSHGSAYGSVRC